MTKFLTNHWAGSIVIVFGSRAQGGRLDYQLHPGWAEFRNISVAFFCNAVPLEKISEG